MNHYPLGSVKGQVLVPQTPQPTQIYLSCLLSCSHPKCSESIPESTEPLLPPSPPGHHILDLSLSWLWEVQQKIRAEQNIGLSPIPGQSGHAFCSRTISQCPFIVHEPHSPGKRGVLLKKWSLWEWVWAWVSVDGPWHSIPSLLKENTSKDSQIQLTLFSASYLRGI